MRPPGGPKRAAKPPVREGRQSWRYPRPRGRLSDAALGWWGEVFTLRPHSNLRLGAVIKSEIAAPAISESRITPTSLIRLGRKEGGSRAAEATVPSTCLRVSSQEASCQSYYQEPISSAAWPADRFHKVAGRWLIRRLSSARKPIEITDPSVCEAGRRKTPDHNGLQGSEYPSGQPSADEHPEGSSPAQI